MPSQTERRSATRVAILSAARQLFGSKSFARVTIDDVVALAGVTKGGLYHHFDSKDALFTEILIAEQQRLADVIVSNGSSDMVELFTCAVRDYLIAASAPVTRQILLIDGPAVLGWAKWREIDQRMFGQLVRQAVSLMRSGNSADTEVEALSNLVMGAVMEAAMVCATSSAPEQSAHQASAALRLLIIGLRN